MYYTNKLENHKLSSYTTNPQIAELNGLNIEVAEVETAWDGSLWEKGFASLAPQKTYAEKRQEEYPPLSDQLDMIYWDKVNGTNIWQTTIAEIKAKYPKN